MDNTRNYILTRLKSRRTSIDEFNFDSLVAPPLYMFLSPYDIQQIHSIARSLKLSAKPEVRYEEIDKICKSRGLIKFGAGTNRVVYRHPEFPDLLLKIAADDVGMRDNPAEFRNQLFLKPFVAKCFEISPCGTVALCERVNPITSREEFISIADDAFELLTEWIIGKYVVADCGSNFFMNFGIRRGFGVVLLDYPYVYELDGDKLFCNKDDQFSPSGKCDGVIDYDDGFNFLKCTKCGAIYKAKELETKIKCNELIKERQGEIKMKITLKGGKNSETRVVDTNTGVSSIPFGSSIKVDTKKIKLKEEINKDEGKTLKVKVSKKVEETVKDDCSSESVKVEEKSVNGVSTEVKKPAARSPISISEEIKEEAIKAKAEQEKVTLTPVQAIEMALETIKENINKIDIDVVKKDTLDSIFESVIDLYKEKDNSIIFYALVSALLDILGNSEEDLYKEFIKCKDLSYLFNSIYKMIPVLTNVEIVDDNVTFNYMINVHPFIEGIGDEEDKILDTEFTVDGSSIATIEKAIYNIPEEVENKNEEEESSEEDYTYKGLSFYDAERINIKDIFPDEQSMDILVIKDEDGNYLTNKDRIIIGIDTVSDESVDETYMVSKHWYDAITSDEESCEEDTEVEDNTDDEEDIVKEVPVGVEAPSMEEFIENEESSEKEE